MLKEKSCGAVVFRKEKGKSLYLLLHYEAGHWDFPKGNQEVGEEEKETIKREILEETGIKDIEILDGFEHIIKYMYRNADKKLVSKQVTFYIAETKSKNIKLSFEHIGFSWLELKSALNKITYKNSAELLEAANLFLSFNRH